MARINCLCTEGIRIRKEYRDMTEEEWLTFKSVLYDFGKTEDYDEFTRTHLQHSHMTHK